MVVAYVPCMGSGVPTSFFTESLFSRRVIMGSSPFIKAMHPKTEISPEPTAMERILRSGWVGQLKIHGHRAQVHVPADPNEPVIAYNRQGKQHKKRLSEAMTKEICRLFRPKKGWNVIDAEWLKDKEKLFIFDILKLEGEVLRRRNYPERWKLLPRAFISPYVSVLPLLRDLSSCLKAMNSTASYVEGLVFKSSTSTGFSDTSVVRCRKRK